MTRGKDFISPGTAKKEEGKKKEKNWGKDWVTVWENGCFFFFSAWQVFWGRNDIFWPGCWKVWEFDDNGQ